MNVQSVRNYNSVKSITVKNTRNAPIEKSVNIFSTKEEKISTDGLCKKYLFEYGHDENGKLYHVKGSIAEDSTDENPKIKIEYFSDNRNENPTVKYIEINKINPRNATLEEYDCLTAYLFRDKPYYSYEPNTTGIHYNWKDRYDFVELLERDIKMYQANGIHHHVARYQNILNRIETFMSKNNVDIGQRGIGVKEALTISRKKHGIPYGSIKINKAIDMVDKYLEENKNRQIKEKKEQIKRIRAKRKQDKEELEELLEKLRVNREFTKEKILETQAERKKDIARIQKENLLKNNPYKYKF